MLDLAHFQLHRLNPLLDGHRVRIPDFIDLLEVTQLDLHRNLTHR